MMYYCHNCNSEPLSLTKFSSEPNSSNFDKECCPDCGNTNVSKIDLDEPNLKQFAAELEELKNEEPATVLMPPLAAFAIVTHIQLASRHPHADTAITKIAIDTAHQLQKLFNPESTTYQVLEMGWNPELDRPIEEKS